jgi:hypothetical protein
MQSIDFMHLFDVTDTRKGVDPMEGFLKSVDQEQLKQKEG